MGAILDFPQEKDGISICQNIRLKLLMCVLSVTKALNGNTLLLPIWLFIQWKRSTYAKNVDFLPPMLQHSSFTKEITMASWWNARSCWAASFKPHENPTYCSISSRIQKTSHTNAKFAADLFLLRKIWEGMLGKLIPLTIKLKWHI